MNIRKLPPSAFNLSYPCVRGMTRVQADRFCQEAECVETDPWAVRAILRAEILTPRVIDPCCGPGVMSKIAIEHGYDVYSSDLHDWGYGNVGINWLEGRYPVPVKDATVLLNPPFSLACEFIDRALDLGARKVVAFQRLAFKESDERRAWWEARRYQRDYTCGKRAQNWRATFSAEYRKGRTNPMATAFYVWEAGQPAGPISGVIYPEAA